MILISIGANLPAPDGAPPLETCRRAAAALDGIAGLRLCGLSRWYVSAPVLAAGQSPEGHPTYVNGIAHLRPIFPPAPDPAFLLRTLMELEARAGRVRAGLNAPRVLDLDIVSMGGLVRDAPDPVLPHPRTHQRAFVLRPLADVAPQWVHPRLGRRVSEMLLDVKDQQCAPLP